MTPIDDRDVAPLYYRTGEEVQEGDYVVNARNERDAIVEYVDIGVGEIHLLYKHGETGVVDAANLDFHGRGE